MTPASPFIANTKDRAMHRHVTWGLARRPWRAARRLAGFAVAGCLAAGCAGGPGSPLAMVNPTHKLLDSAKEMRW